MPALPKDLLVKIKGSSAELEKAAQRSQSVLRRVGGAAKGTAVAVAGIGAAAAGLAFAIKRGLIDPFTEQQAAVASLGAALAATGKVGVDSLKAVADEASRLQRITTFGDEALIKASGTLATLAPALQADEIVKAQTAIAAIATTFTKGDTEAAAQLLGKTLGSTTNALGRYGIAVDTSASASEKLSQILGSGTLGASFEVAQEQARTLKGRFQQLANVAGDAREVLGEIVVKALGLGERTGSLVDRIADMNDAINQNMDRWVAWTRVGIEAVKAVVISLVEVVRMLWNVGQIGYRAFGALALTVGQAFEAVFNAIKSAANAIIEGLNALPGIEIDFRFEESNRFAEAAQEQVAAIKGDVDTLVASTGRFADAWVDVGFAIARARNTEAGNSDPLAAAAAGLNGGAGGAGTGEDIFKGLKVGKVGSGLLRLLNPAELVGDASRALKETAERNFHLAGIWLEYFGTKTSEYAAQLETLKDAGKGFVNDFATALGNAFINGKEAFTQFRDAVLAGLAQIAAKFAIFYAIKAIFGASTGGVTSFVGSALGFAAEAPGAAFSTRSTPSAAAGRLGGASAQRAAFSLTIDVSGMPPATDPRQAARDPDWLRFLSHSNRTLVAGGG